MKIFEIGEKYYFEDLGIRNAIRPFRATDIGQVLENVVCHHLLVCGYALYIGRDGDKEVDFVLREGTRILRLVQVCYDISSPKTEKREVDSIVECAGELKCDNLVIVTYNYKCTIEKDGYKIDVVPITEF